jgi:hypothetical protein
MPYNDTLFFTPYQDSIFQLRLEYWMTDSLVRYIGGIDKYQILKQEKKGSVEAFVYYDSKYVETFIGEPELWVAHSEDNRENMVVLLYWHCPEAAFVRQVEFFLSFD